MLMTHSDIQSSNSVALFTHINPDGDALGSTLGMMGWLMESGKDVHLFVPSIWGASLDFMIPANVRQYITVWDEQDKEFIQSSVNSCDLLIGLDFNTLERIGSLKDVFKNAKGRKLLIDHHLGPETEAFDSIDSCAEVSSTCELLYKILMTMPGIDGNAAKLPPLSRQAILTGITTDTNNFANSVYPDTLSICSELIAAGADRNSIIQALYFNYPERRLRAMGYVLNKKMTILPEGVGYIILTRHDLMHFGLQEGETEGFVNMPLSIAGVRMSIMLKQEHDTNKVRVSIRSKEGTSARRMAMTFFNGGGHELASGGKLMLGEDLKNMKKAASYIENAVKKFFSDEN